MFPFNSYEATKILVDDHLAELRRSATRRRPARSADARSAQRHGVRLRLFP